MAEENMSGIDRNKIKVGNRFWLSQVGLYIGLIGVLFFILFLGILYTGNGLTAEMSLIYYTEIMYRYIYYGIGISIITCFIGFWLSERRIWTKHIY